MDDIKKKLYDEAYRRVDNIYRSYIDCFKLQESSLEFNIVDKSDIGGKSWCNEGTDNIEIKKGVFEKSFDYFLQMSQEKNFELLKLITKEKDEEQIRGMSFEYVIRDDINEFICGDSKKDDLLISSMLCMFVYRFIFTHELGHLLNGHCAYVQYVTNGKLNYMPMYPDNELESSDKCISPLDFRTMEMDADAFAVTDNFRYIVDIYNNFERMFNKAVNIKPIDIFYWWSLAIRSQFILQQDSFRIKYCCEEHYYDDMRYLPNIGRWGMIWCIIDRIITEKIYKINFRSGDNEERILKTLMDGVLNAEKYYNQLKFTNFSFVNEVLNNEDFFTYSSEINNNWNNRLVNVLKKYARLKLYE